MQVKPTACLQSNSGQGFVLVIMENCVLVLVKVLLVLMESFVSTNGKFC